MSLEIIDIVKTYGKLRAVDDVSLGVGKGEIVAIVGPSGCGKSTVLNLTAGLEQPDSGDIRWEGVSVVNMQPHLRDFGLMFQDYALFPHLSVFENVAFGLRIDKLERAAIERRVKEMLDLANLEGYEQRDVSTLSGGEAQRVALARSLAPAPRLLMLDEPLGALDRALREELMVELRHILKEIHQTAIYVTHDQEEAFGLADRVVVMNRGRVEQAGPPQEIYRRPASLFVARFIGLENFIPAQIEAGGRTAVTPLGRLSVPAAQPGEAVLLLRPEKVSLHAAPPGEHPEMVTLRGQLAETIFRGAACRVRVRVGEMQFLFELPSHLPLPAAGEEVWVSFRPEEAVQAFKG
jgi:ABC-type Fe3+/spermidine/putrescine transport system ATPase subunit